MGVAQSSRARLALLCAVALLSAACTAPSDPANGDASNAASSTSAGAGDGPPGPADPNATYVVYTEAPPGPLKGAQYGDDLLLLSDKTIPDEVIHQIRSVRLDGKRAVRGAVSMSVGSFSLENRNYTIAAADVSAYRRFTPGASGAVFQDAWDRVAAGEIAVNQELKDRIPLDKDGYVSVGSGDQRFPIHLGAWTSQVGTIDAVVNTEWGEALGLPEHNALVLNTGEFSPQAVKKKLSNFQIPITDLDIVAEAGIDIGAKYTAQVVGTFADAVGVFRYTPIGGGRVQPEASWVRSHIVTDTVPLLGTITCNKFMMPQLKEALAEVVRSNLGKEVYQTAGCYYPRYIAGSTTLSNHSFGLAIDINSTENQRGTVGQMSRAVVAIFKKWGFAWGGDWNYTDPMHFELERIVNPG